jgi:hypothetical protein
MAKAKAKQMTGYKTAVNQPRLQARIPPKINKINETIKKVTAGRRLQNVVATLQSKCKPDENKAKDI